ncbi:hypothetical protein J5N97_008527 [Dioscorea zingiberensis]|uniref:Transcription initiation factor TFIID component TAF4 C-terminal domain-containing protein n=1 Tax=Dioscorea zingiberensis TaxID=325984 RepID=A0A9D5CWH4_9LILI|nr:hypothetical protein J5N97_008527 [Dioscorea zingiberensis]
MDDPSFTKYFESGVIPDPGTSVRFFDMQNDRMHSKANLDAYVAWRNREISSRADANATELFQTRDSTTRELYEQLHSSYQGVNLVKDSLANTAQHSFWTHGSQITRITSQILPKTPTSSTATALTTTPKKKRSVRLETPIGALDASSMKKQKMTVSSVDHIGKLNDVTAFTEINLRDEEKMLLSAPKEGQVSKATERLVEEEEGRLILQKDPLQKKLAKIITKCGIASIGNDVERLLSMCVEERLRNLLPNLIRLSKKREDVEKSRHQVVVTADIRRHILSANQKAKKDHVKKHSEDPFQKKTHPEEVKKIPKLLDEVKDTCMNASKFEVKDCSMEVTDTCMNARKLEFSESAGKISAANFAAHSAVGTDAVHAKWQLMAEEARQRRERGLEGGTIGSQVGTASGNKSNLKSPTVMSDPQITGRITIKDVISALGREKQMSNSVLLYTLYQRME